jgi:Mg2+-importing ATPase
MAVSTPASLPSSPGLTCEEAAQRLAQNGPNVVARGTSRPAFRILWGQLSSPLVLVLLGVAGVSRLLGEKVETTVILLVVALNALLAFVQEYRAGRALQALRRFVTRTARVRREGRILEVPATEVVRGDVVLLELGDFVPADLVVDAGEDLATDEAALTGESVPVSKEPGAIARMGTAVVSGFGTGVVSATGAATLFGRSAGLLEEVAPETDFERNIRRFSNFLVQVIVLLTLFVFLANALLGKGWFDSFLFAVALAVGITPEVLPAIVAITLANGALRMARDKVVVKRLAAVEDLGNVDILCCDKTGTLTRGEFSLHDFVAPDGSRDSTVLLLGALTGAAGSGAPHAGSANATDRAIWASDGLGLVREELARYGVVDRAAFDFRRRRSSVLVSTGGASLVVVKGAPESVLPLCAAVHDGRDSTALGAEGRGRLASRVAAYEENGLRVLAVASRPAEGSIIRVADESDLCLRGFLLFADPCKPDVRAALERLVRLGVGIRIMSGDSPVVTRRVCLEGGIPLDGQQVMTGDELARLSPDERSRRALECRVFARLTPEQKQQLVAALRAAGHVVGFLGDGVNDAAALHAADVGISVDSGTDIAKEASDIILLQKSLDVLAGGIVEGRKTFANITKYILNTISANFGNMSTVAASSLFLSFIPLLPSQILLNNFLSDVPLVTVATDRVDPDLLRRPRRWDIAGIARFMVIFGLLSAAFDLLLITVLLRWATSVAVFRTAWFVESACSEVLVTFAIRTRLRFWRSPPSRWLVWSSLATAAVAFGLPFTAFGRRYFEFVPLPGQVVGLTVGVLAAYFLAAELAKRPFFRRLEQTSGRPLPRSFMKSSSGTG